MFDVTRMENGNLKITASGDEIEIIRDGLEDRGFWYTFTDAFESYSCNGSYQPFDAGDGNPFVGLTNAPCIAESMDYDDDGNASIIGDFWYYDDYAITCPMETLCETGEVIFTLAN
jgi:hypothetical protein